MAKLKCMCYKNFYTQPNLTKIFAPCFKTLIDPYKKKHPSLNF